MIRLIILVWIGLFIGSCSRDMKEKKEQNDTVTRDSLSRPDDVGEHKSIHQEEWEYYQSDTSNIK
ncbi:hypothetical protein KJ762_04370 [bacterium]|nr:hypothetical protein [bacterium]MBU1064624.1 hypothetical protein [bacterium]MBU1633729.1 hypothetical protein [bacterium]MBU1874349.1 hypothetical protein [bacterium]